MCLCLDIEEKVRYSSREKPQDSIELLFDEQSIAR
jgi:hypothetical protein